MPSGESTSYNYLTINGGIWRVPARRQQLSLFARSKKGKLYPMGQTLSPVVHTAIIATTS